MSSQQAPDRPVVGMRRRVVAGRCDGTRIAPQPSASASSTAWRRELGVGERNEADGDQPLVVARRTRPSRGCARACRRRAARGRRRLELGRRERAEHQLRVEPEQVEGAAAFRRIERAERAPALVAHHVLFERGPTTRDACGVLRPCGLLRRRARPRRRGRAGGCDRAYRDRRRRRASRPAPSSGCRRRSRCGPRRTAWRLPRRCEYRRCGAATANVRARRPARRFLQLSADRGV